MTFYFYDLETTGFSPSSARIMQFAGQRTDTKLKPIGKPDNILIKVTPDTLPDPGAVLVHNITPQKTFTEGITEAEFCKYLTSKVFTSNTVTVGYNNIRFDNNFIRFTFWRNFHDAYEWSWKNGCSTWDLLDVVRMMRALRPEGIEWPFKPDGQPTNSLEYLTSVNKLPHIDAHDASSDVVALIALAQLLRSKQPRLFDYLFKIRSKDKVRPLVSTGEPIIYTSGRYPSEYDKTTIVAMAAEKNDKSGALMYDLRIDPDEFKDLPAKELAKRWAERGEDAPYFPVKVMAYNRCPAVAPLTTLDKPGYQRLQLHPETIDGHLKKLQKADGLGDKLLDALDIMWPPRPKTKELFTDPLQVDGQLYDAFLSDRDRTKMSAIRAAKPDELDIEFDDVRLNALLPLYKARNFPDKLSEEEKQGWQIFRHQKLVDSGALKKFKEDIKELSKTPGLNRAKQHALVDLSAYADSISNS